MIPFFTYAGKNCRDYGVTISGARSYGTAERDLEPISIPGRNGDLYYDNGRFKNVPVTYDGYITRNFNANYNGFNAWLMSQSGYQRLEDSYQPEYFRMARFSAGLQSEPVIRLGVGSFSVAFDCMPQKFLKLGEIIERYSANGSILNPTRFNAKPLIHCVGTGGTVSIGGVAVTVSSCTASVDIDCELMEVYEGTISRNGVTTLPNGSFPVIKPGEWSVTFSGWTQVSITPRWWTI